MTLPRRSPVIAAVALCSLVAACGGSDDATDTDADTEASDEPAAAEAGDEQNDADAGADDETNAGEDTDDQDDGSDAGADAGSDELVEMSGEVEVLSSGGATLAYTVTLPAGFAVTEFSTPINPTWEDPNNDFGDRNTRVSVLATPIAATAADLVASFQTVNSSITVLDEVDEPGGFSWFTYTTPSTSDENAIAFGSAQSARTLADGTSLQCTASTQNGIDEDWTEADAIQVANQMLTICTSVTAG